MEFPLREWFVVFSQRDRYVFCAVFRTCTRLRTLSVVRIPTYWFDWTRHHFIDCVDSQSSIELG